MRLPTSGFGGRPGPVAKGDRKDPARVYYPAVPATGNRVVTLPCAIPPHRAAERMAGGVFGRFVTVGRIPANGLLCDEPGLPNHASGTRRTGRSARNHLL